MRKDVNLKSARPEFWFRREHRRLRICLHEITYGLRLLSQGKRRSELEEKLQRLLSEYSDLVISIGRSEADQAALVRIKSKHQGRAIHLADALIAGTAKAHNLYLVTRNVDDFWGLDIDLINPWNKK